MRLPEAIEKGQTIVDTGMYDEYLWKFLTLKLLIEAGKRELECRASAPREDWCLLPGETKE